MDQSLHVQLAEEGADYERLQRLAGHLRDELRDVGGVEPTLLQAGEAPEGSRALDIIVVGGLVLKLLDSAALWAAIDAIRGWPGGARGPLAPSTSRSATTRRPLGRDNEDQERLVDMFVNRHTSQGTGSRGRRAQTTDRCDDDYEHEAAGGFGRRPLMRPLWPG